MLGIGLCKLYGVKIRISAMKIGDQKRLMAKRLTVYSIPNSLKVILINGLSNPCFSDRYKEEYIRKAKNSTRRKSK